MNAFIPQSVSQRPQSTRSQSDDPVTRAYKRFTRQLRLAAAQYVDRRDVDDLVQDVFVVVSQRPAKLAMPDRQTLSWLIGIAKRCAPAYRSCDVRTIPLDELLAGEAGDDAEGRAIHEEDPEEIARRTRPRDKWE
jgi:DNA-directed RNA polymerase specialized sigma24 family protein